MKKIVLGIVVVSLFFWIVRPTTAAPKFVTSEEVARMIADSLTPIMDTLNEHADRLDNYDLELEGVATHGAWIDKHEGNIDVSALRLNNLEGDHCCTSSGTWLAKQYREDGTVSDVKNYSSNRYAVFKLRGYPGGVGGFTLYKSNDGVYWKVKETLELNVDGWDYHEWTIVLGPRNDTKYFKLEQNGSFTSQVDVVFYK